MSDDTASSPEKQTKKKKKGAKLLLPMLAVVFAAVGFAVSYMGMLPFTSSASAASKPHAKPEMPVVEFVDIPTIALPIPGAKHRSIILTAAIETDAAYRAEIEHLMPRVQDAFTSFLSNVDGTAYDKRGVLEIIRAELVTRSRFVLGEEPVRDLLITEFRIK